MRDLLTGSSQFSLLCLFLLMTNAKKPSKHLPDSLFEMII
jgi:hypothetical protein